MELYDLFARILEPPGPSLSDEVNECISMLAPSQGKVQEREGRWLKLISGIVMVGLSVVMIVKPDWLM